MYSYVAVRRFCLLSCVIITCFCLFFNYSISLFNIFMFVFHFVNCVIFIDIVSIIKIQRLEWLGHVVRMNETRSVKKIFEGKLEGRRGRGRPRLRERKHWKERNGHQL